jgi:hypothetical protein
MVWHWGYVVADSRYYFQLALHFAGRFPTDQLRLPFAYEAATPWMAAHMPFDVTFNFALLNYLAVVAAAIVVYSICRGEGFTDQCSALGGWLIVISVPTFAYAPYLLTDPTALLWRACLIWALRAHNAIWVLPVGLIGVATREDTLVLLGAGVVWTVWQRRWSETVVWTSTALLGVGCSLLIRHYFASLGVYDWKPGLYWLKQNLRSPSNYLSVAAGVGVVWPLAVLGFLHPGRLSRETARFWAFLSLALLTVPAYALVSARFDGRPFWTAYPAAIPLAAAGFEHLTARRLRTSPTFTA